MNNELFKTSTQGLYNQHLQDTVRLYFDAYELLHNIDMGDLRNVVTQSYQERLTTYTPEMERERMEMSQGIKTHRDEVWYRAPFFRLLEELGPFSEYYDDQIAMAFWIRRSIDGTDELFFELLTLLLRTYDPGFLKQEG